MGDGGNGHDGAFPHRPQVQHPQRHSRNGVQQNGNTDYFDAVNMNGNFQ